MKETKIWKSRVRLPLKFQTIASSYLDLEVFIFSNSFSWPSPFIDEKIFGTFFSTSYIIFGLDIAIDVYKELK